jgi:5-methylcytosine-specific restriction endonuclease McrA
MAGVKEARIRNPELIKFVRNQPCLICGKTAPNDAHHVISRGAGGEDEPENLMPLCSGVGGHHSMWHQRGILTMSKTFPQVSNWLKLAGFEICETKGTWKKPIDLN